MVRPRLSLGANSITLVQILNVRLLLFVINGPKKKKKIKLYIHIRTNCNLSPMICCEHSTPHIFVIKMCIYIACINKILL